MYNFNPSEILKDWINSTTKYLWEMSTKAWKHAFYFQAHKQLLTEIVQIQPSISVSQTLKQGRLIYIIISLYNNNKHQTSDNHPFFFLSWFIIVISVHVAGIVVLVLDWIAVLMEQSKQSSFARTMSIRARSSRVAARALGVIVRSKYCRFFESLRSSTRSCGKLRMSTPGALPCLSTTVRSNMTTMMMRLSSAWLASNTDLA